MDAWAERELAGQLAGNSWSNRSRLSRLGLALACTAPTTAIVAGLAYLAAPEWWWAFPAGWACLGTLAFVPYVIAPEGTIRFLFRLGYVSDADARKPPLIP